MSAPRVVAVAPGSVAAQAGLTVGDEIVTVNGEVPRDLIEWRVLLDEPHLALDVRRGGLELPVQLDKGPGEPLGVEVHSALFDRVRTCDNHCEFCFIYQLPPGLRRSLYLKDDDYRLSFLYGNFTTLTRFTEADLERVVTEGLSPLYVSIHATDPDVRAGMLRNRRGATSLRWLRALLDHGVEVHGQVVLCPGVNDGAVLDDTLAGVLDRYPELATLCVVPLGVSRFNREARMRPHRREEAGAVLDAVHDWQDVFLAALGRRLVFAADEYYLLAGRPFPAAEDYEGFPMHEDGVGMARAFESELLSGHTVPAGAPGAPAGGAAGTWGAVAGCVSGPSGASGASPHQHACGSPPGGSARDGGPVRSRPGDANADADGGRARDRGGFFRWADGGDAAAATGTDYEPYRGPRAAADAAASSSGVDAGGAAGDGGAGNTGPRLHVRPSRRAPVAVLTAPYGAAVLGPLLERLGRSDVRIVPVENRYFGGNIAVSGLMVGEDLARVLADQPAGHRYLIPDVCLSQGRFLDGTTPADLPRPVDVVPTTGAALRQALGLDPAAVPEPEAMSAPEAMSEPEATSGPGASTASPVGA